MNNEQFNKEVALAEERRQLEARLAFGLNGTAAYDVVSKPKHYMLFEQEGIEVRDVIEKLVGKFYKNCHNLPEKPTPLLESDYVQMMQYLMRFMDKNGVEDLKKARWYLDKMIDSY